jgi:hypothetical protein
MADGEHRTVNAVKPPASQASVPTLAVDAHPLELSQRNDSVLPGGDSRDGGISVGFADFCIHVHAEVRKGG